MISWTVPGSDAGEASRAALLSHVAIAKAVRSSPILRCSRVPCAPGA